MALVTFLHELHYSRYVEREQGHLIAFSSVKLGHKERKREQCKSHNESESPSQVNLTRSELMTQIHLVFSNEDKELATFDQPAVVILNGPTVAMVTLMA